MKTLIISVLATAVLVGCSGQQQLASQQQVTGAQQQQLAGQQQVIVHPSENCHTHQKNSLTNTDSHCHKNPTGKHTYKNRAPLGVKTETPPTKGFFQQIL